MCNVYFTTMKDHKTYNKIAIDQSLKSANDCLHWLHNYLNLNIDENCSIDAQNDVSVSIQTHRPYGLFLFTDAERFAEEALSLEDWDLLGLTVYSL